MLLPLFAALAAVTAQAEPKSPTDCAGAGHACRVVAPFDLRGPQGQRITVPTGGVPRRWIFQDNVLVFVGESVTIAFDRRGGELAPRVVRTGRQSERTAPADGELRFALRQQRDGEVVLTAESRHPEPLDYMLLANRLGLPPAFPPVCPLRPGGYVTEKWSSPIAQVNLIAFRRSAAAAAPCASLAGEVRQAEPKLIDGRLVLPLGASVTVAVGPNGVPQIRSSGRAADRPRTALDARAPADPSKETVEAVALPPGAKAPPPPPADLLRLSLEKDAQGAVRLIVENGYARTLDYQGAVRHPDGRVARTTVCEVFPKLRGVEIWQDPVVQVELGGFRFGAAEGPRRPVCD